MRSVTTQGSITTTSTFTYDGLLLQRTASERSDGTTLSVSCLFDEESDPYAAIYESGEATPVVFTIITTDRGDVRELLDEGGASFAFYGYDAFGRPTETTTTATASWTPRLPRRSPRPTPPATPGTATMAFSGLYYLSQRYYDPATAQFITKDPAKADGEESAYQYCGGDPVGKVDPSGLSYSASKAVKYASWYYKSPNRSHYRYEGATDCANFVSQCLHDASGGGMYATLKWGHSMLRNTIAWNSAEGLRAYLSTSRGFVVASYSGAAVNKKSQFAYMSAVRVGDVVFY